MQTFPSVIWKGYFQTMTSMGEPVHMGSQANQLKERFQAEPPPPFFLHVFPWVGSHYKPTGKVQGQSHHVNSYRLTGSLGLEAEKVRSLSQQHNSDLRKTNISKLGLFLSYESKP